MSAPAADRAADAAARRAAQTELDAAIVLEAGAGTGKTTVLISRVLAWCLGRGWERAERRLASAVERGPERIAEELLPRVVAITFTEAAAAEMEVRALGAFRAIAAGAPVLGFDASLLAVPEPEQRRRAEALSRVSDQLRFQTIHAFCRRVLSTHALAAGLHPRFFVDASGAERASAVRETLEAWLREIRADGDPDLEALLIDGVGAPELESVLVELAAAAIPVRDFAADPLAPDRVAAWAQRLRDGAEAFLAAEAGRFATLAASATARRVGDAVARTRDLLATVPGADLDDVVRGLRALWEESLVERVRKLARGDLGSSERKALGEERVPALAVAAGSLCEPLRGLAALHPAALARLHRVLAPLHARVAERLAERGAEAFDALLRRTRDLLVESPEIAAALRGEIDQLLVDEFQDTDRVQCEIVAALALDGDPAARPTLFVVGDPKQSIYGWRNADVGAYMRFVERVIAEAAAARHVLCVSHRSVPAVLAEVQQVVAPNMIEDVAVQPAFQPLFASEANAGVADSGIEGVPAVEYWCSDAWDPERGAFGGGTAAEAVALEARHLAADLLRLAPRMRWSQVAVLLRATGELDAYLGALRAAGIPYCVDRDRDFHRRREVRDAVALVCTVLDPNDAVSLVAAMRSAWIGVPDAAWRPLWAGDFPALARAAIEGDAAAHGRITALAGEVARDVAEVSGVAAVTGWEQSLVHGLAVIAALRRSYECDGVDAFVEALRTWTLFETTEAARHPGLFRVANLSRFFRELAVALEAQAGDVAQVLRALRRTTSGQTEVYEGRPGSPDENAVSVMTIHGAKGLDFEHVYVMQMHKGTANPVRAFEHDVHGGRIEWRLSKSRLGASTLGWSAAAERRRAVSDAEAVRTLYVAATRAKRRLVLAGRFEDGASRELAHARLVRGAREAALAEARERMLAEGAGRARMAGAPDASCALVRWLAREPLEAFAPCAAGAPAALALDGVRADVARLASLDLAARERALRRLVGRASEQSAELHREDRVERWQAGGAPADPDAAEREVAAAVGTAIHALLERYDWNAADADAEWQRRVFDAHAALDRSVSEAQRAAAGARAEQLLASLREGPLFERIRAHAIHTIARELPFLLPGAESGADAVGASVGAIDWIHWDPVDREVVVVDFKSDRIADSASIAERVRHHAAQAERYRVAAQQALGLERLPRVELWFLAANAREVIEVSPNPP